MEENTEIEGNEENSQERDENDNLRVKKNRKFDMKFKLAVVKYAEQHSGMGATDVAAATDDKRLHLSGGGRNKVSEELDIFTLKNIQTGTGRCKKK